MSDVHRRFSVVTQEQDWNHNGQLQTSHRHQSGSQGHPAFPPRRTCGDGQQALDHSAGQIRGGRRRSDSKQAADLFHLRQPAAAPPASIQMSSER